MNELFRSSDGTGNLSTTVEGTLTVILSVIILLGAHFGFQVPEQELGVIIQQIVEAVGYIVAGIGSIVTVIGSVKKLWNKTFKKLK